MKKLRFIFFWGLFILSNGETKGQPVNEVIYMWSGAITPASARVNAKLTSTTTQARLLASTDISLSSPIYGPYVVANLTNNHMAALSVTGLASNTKYYYAVEADGVIDNSADDIGSFSTAATGNASYRFAVGGCGVNSNHAVYNRMSEKTPLFFLALGDFHYDNPNSGVNINVHRLPYENNMLSQPASRNFFRNVPLAYVWDDHDYSGNDSDSISAGKTNARLAYQEYVPHYPLARGNGNVPIYQSFTIGKLHFILADLRSTRRHGAVIWDAPQRAWFESECLWAKNNNMTIAWVSSVSFGGTIADNWGGYTAERTSLSNFFRDNEVQYLFILSGDAHMLAIDNGANHDFSTDNNNPFNYPVFAAAALNRSGSNKGGNYNVKPDGTVDGTPGASYVYLNDGAGSNGQYGVVDVEDNGVQLCISFTGYRVSAAGVETVLTTYEFCRAAGSPLPVKLASFTARVIGEKVQLNWEVSEQTNCEEYEVERSADGINYTTLTKVNCHSSFKYSVVDGRPFKGVNFYRLKMKETGGQISYSGIVKLSTAQMGRLQIQPNPVKGHLQFQLLQSSAASNGTYIIYDITGKKISEGNVTIAPGTMIHVKTPVLAPGSYLLTLKTGKQEFQERFIVQ